MDGYYRKYIQHNAWISRPLHQLLKKGGFSWTDKYQVANETLKKALANTPVLILPDFSETFVIETDASNLGIGVVLMQYGHPLTYLSKTLRPRW